MTNPKYAVLATGPVYLLAVASGHHPVAIAPLLVGALLPQLDAVRREYHRSWLLHTWLLPALVYQALSRVGAFDAVPLLLSVVHFLSVGMLLHFLADYVYPRELTNPGAAWPVRPEGPQAPVGGLFMLGLSWTVQWFFYLVPAFLPWLFG